MQISSYKNSTTKKESSKLIKLLLIRDSYIIFHFQGRNGVQSVVLPHLHLRHLLLIHHYIAYRETKNKRFTDEEVDDVILHYPRISLHESQFLDKINQFPFHHYSSKQFFCENKKKMNI